MSSEKFKIELMKGHKSVILEEIHKNTEIINSFEYKKMF